MTKTDAVYRVRIRTASPRKAVFGILGGVVASILGALLGGMAEPFGLEPKVTIEDISTGHMVWSRADSELPMYVHTRDIRDEIADDISALSLGQFRHKWLSDYPGRLPKTSRFADGMEGLG